MKLPVKQVAKIEGRLARKLDKNERAAKGAVMAMHDMMELGQDRLERFESKVDQRFNDVNQRFNDVEREFDREFEKVRRDRKSQTVSIVLSTFVAIVIGTASVIVTILLSGPSG